MVKLNIPRIAALASLIFALAPATQAAPTADRAAADQLFAAGKFAQAGQIDARLAARDPADYASILQLGRVALLSNDLAAARRWLSMATALRPAEAQPRIMLAEAYYRQDDFQKAAETLRGVDTVNNKLIADQYPTLNLAKLESFKGQTPYQVTGPGEMTELTFVRTDPLPVVSVRVNGGAPVTFFIDTGGSEVVLDKAFAQELGAPIFGVVKGTFSGGQQADVAHSRIDSLTLGDWTVHNLPAVVLPLRQLSAGLGVRQIDGIIGTTLFYHFLATLDYRHGKLVLRRKTPDATSRFLAASGGRVTVPIWMASDHFMVSWGQVESLPPSLLFIDTGLAGAGVKLASSVIDKAGIVLDQAKATEGQGGGGALKIVPYTVHRLALGGLVETNVAGLYDGPFPWEESFGFHLAGMVGHDLFKSRAVTFDFRDMQMLIQ